jgi:pimeloyl-ACP methyl ester carboxylesterase
MNCPHPERLAKGLLRPSQLKRSSYMLFFQVPRLPERLLAKDDYRLLCEAFRSELVPPCEFGPEEYERYVEAFSKPGALTSMLHYYRALSRPSGHVPWRVIDLPVLVLWGARDRHLGRELATPNPRWVRRARVEWFEDASHWLHHERAERVNQSLIEFFSSAGAEAAQANSLVNPPG